MMIMMFLQKSTHRMLRRVNHLAWHCQIQHTSTSFTFNPSGKRSYYDYYGTSSTSSKYSVDFFPLASFGTAALVFLLKRYSLLADDDSTASVTENINAEGYLSNLHKIEDGSIVSNEHTVKWRIFTDNARSFFLKGNLDEAEKFFYLALQEAKSGFGERDAHVASSLNNLAELYRVKKELEKAEPLYLSAVEILKESFGPEDVRLGAAFHNLGQFYIVQHKLEEAHKFYELALKIKGRVLGHGHPDYADTMYHLGIVLHLLGKNEDAKVLVEDSIRVLENGGLGESVTCIRRLKYLAQILLSLNLFNEAENIQRKVLHILELSKSRDSLDTINAAESLALTLQSIGNLVESQELLERCLNANKSLLGEDHIMVASNMLHLAKNSMLYSTMLSKINVSDAATELDKADAFLGNSLRIARLHLAHQKENEAKSGLSLVNVRKERNALIILLRALDAVGLLEVARCELQQKHENCVVDISMLHECILIFKDPTTRKLLDLPDVKDEYLMCLKHILSIVKENSGKEMQQSMQKLKDLENEVMHIEAELAPTKHHPKLT